MCARMCLERRVCLSGLPLSSFRSPTPSPNFPQHSLLLSGASGNDCCYLNVSGRREDERALIDWDVDDFDDTDGDDDREDRRDGTTMDVDQLYYTSLFSGAEGGDRRGDHSWPPYYQTTPYDEAVENDTHLVACRTQYLILASIDIIAVDPQSHSQIQEYNGRTVYCLKKLRNTVITFLLPTLVNTSSRTYIIVLTVHYFKAGPAWWNGNTHYCTVRDCFNSVEDCIKLLDLLIEEE